MTPDELRLRTALEPLLEGSGFVIHDGGPDGEGFLVHRDLEPREYTLGPVETRVVDAMTHEVTAPGDGTYTVVDERRRGRVVDGLLHWEASTSVERGRHSATRRDLTFRVGRGGLEKTSDSTTRLHEGRLLVDRAAAEVGLRDRAGTAQRVGAAVALGALVLAALAVLVVVVVVRTSGGG